LVTDLQQAFCSVDLDLGSSSIDKTRTINVALAQTLQHCIDNFEYEQILTVIQAAESSR
jgi:hypothetical protein